MSTFAFWVEPVEIPLDDKGEAMLLIGGGDLAGTGERAVFHVHTAQGEIVVHLNAEQAMAGAEALADVAAALRDFEGRLKS